MRCLPTGSWRHGWMGASRVFGFSGVHTTQVPSLRSQYVHIAVLEKETFSSKGEISP